MAMSFNQPDKFDNILQKSTNMWVVFLNQAKNQQAIQMKTMTISKIQILAINQVMLMINQKMSDQYWR